MLLPFLPILQGVAAMVFGLVITSNFVVQAAIKLQKVIFPFISKDKYASLIKIYFKVARIFFLVGGAGFIIFGIISLFQNR